MNTRFSNLFDEPLVPESYGIREPGRISRKHWLIGIATLVLLVGILLLVRSLLGNVPSKEITLFGPQVGQLQSGSPVVMANIEVGHVDRIRLENGRPLAVLVIRREFAREIPGDSKFTVRALGTFMPGNIGVVIEPGNSGGSQALNTQYEVGQHEVDRFGLGGRSLDDIKTALADETIIPASTPTGMYLLIGVAVLVAAVGFGISWKVAKSSFFRYAAIAVAVIAIVFLFYRGLISVGDVREWIEWATNLIGG